MKIIKKIGIALLVIQVFSFYMLETNSICKKRECCGQSKSKPAQSCHCAATTNQPVLKNINFCTCPADLNDQNPGSASRLAESESKTTVQNIKAIINHSGQSQDINLSRSPTSGQSALLIINQFISVDTYLLNCNFLI